MPNSGEINPAVPTSVATSHGTLRSVDEKSLRDAADLIRAGRLVAFPTETVYGLGADATNSRAVAGIFAAKGRPHFNPLIVHVANIAAAERIGVFSTDALLLANAFWPGPVTLVVQRRRDPDAAPMISDLVCAGLSTLAIRIPGEPTALALLSACGVPLAAPSANRSGHVSATTAQHVADDLAGSVAMILDGGPTRRGIESTIIDASGERLTVLRSGALSIEDLRQTSRLEIASAAAGEVKASRPTAPGQLESHYAPRASLRLNATQFADGEAVLAFGNVSAAVTGPVFNLSADGDVIEAAANLFAALRILDASGAPSIAVMPIPMTGLGAAINDRLRRAAAPRP